jgi:hypothetical protein
MISFFNHRTELLLLLSSEKTFLSFYGCFNGAVELIPCHVCVFSGYGNRGCRLCQHCAKASPAGPLCVRVCVSGTVCVSGAVCLSTPVHLAVADEAGRKKHRFFPISRSPSAQETEKSKRRLYLHRITSVVTPILRN